MNNTFTFCLMLFAHVIDDYYLQGILSQMKSKSYWKNSKPEPFYRYDYIAALTAHAFSWSFMITLPIVIQNNFVMGSVMTISLFLNCVLHAWIDDLKANRNRINLWQDQLLHIAQILVTFTVLVGW